MTACASLKRPASGPAASTIPGAGLQVTGGSPDDARLVMEEALLALRIAQRWGPLSHRVTVRIHATHAALESASRQRNVPWMRGWARFDNVELEAPSSWGGHLAKEHVAELLRHELTHVVMYQRVASPQTWTRVSIPMWFREGMASVTSAQGYRRMGTEALAAWIKGHPSEDPWLRPEQLSAAEQPVVYGAAHRAFERIIDRMGDAGVHRILNQTRASQNFARAFRLAAGTAPEEFLRTFRHELEHAGEIASPLEGAKESPVMASRFRRTQLEDQKAVRRPASATPKQPARPGRGAELSLTPWELDEDEEVPRLATPGAWSDDE
jgi:hypothetical protein